MNEPQKIEATSGNTEDKSKPDVTFVDEKKRFDRRIVNFLRLEREGTSEAVIASEKETHKTPTPEDIARWTKEFDRLNRSLEFHTDYGLKAVAFFYAVLGGILSVFFGKDLEFRSASIVLLGVPIIMSWILGYYFFMVLIYGIRTRIICGGSPQDSDLKS